MKPRWEKCAKPMESTFQIIDDGRAIRFAPCGVTSYSQGDVQHRFCAFCDQFIPRANERPE